MINGHAMGTDAERYPWYEIVEEPTIQQGDFLDRCPVIVPSNELPEMEPGEEYTYSAVREDRNVIVMSQSCDLRYEKIDLVLVCPYYGLGDYLKDQDPKSHGKLKENLKRGNVYGYHALAKCTLEGFLRGACVVDFRNVYGMPFGFLKKQVAEQGRRLRLLPPYREHLSQAFARFFMRVGLPIDVDLD